MSARSDSWSSEDAEAFERLRDRLLNMSNGADNTANDDEAMDEEVSDHDPATGWPTKEYLDRLYTEKAHATILQELSGFVSEGGREPGFMWRYARAQFDNNISQPKEETQPGYEEGIEYAQLMIDANPTHFSGYQYTALNLGGIGDFLPLKEKILNVPLIRENAEKALECTPENAVPYHIIGRWCYNIAEVTWMQRKLANTLIGTVPESSHQEALDYFIQADKYATWEFSSNYLWMAKAYLKVGNKEKARECRDKCLETAEPGGIFHNEASNMNI